MASTASRAESSTSPTDGGLHHLAGGILRKGFEVSSAIMKPPAVDDDDASARLKQVVFTVTECCQMAMLDPRFDSLVPRLDAYDEELHGFAYEGAGVGLAALDILIPTRQRTRELASGLGAPNIFGIYLGAGMGLARLRFRPEPFRRRLNDPLFGWVVLDGYGFHEGFFRHQRYVTKQRRSRYVRGFGQRAFDHGIGRSIWFSSGAEIDKIVKTICDFEDERQADLWQGIGLACCYTGGVDRSTISKLRSAAGHHAADLSVGAAMAANIRHHAGNPSTHNDIAAEELCGMSSDQAAAGVEELRADLPTDPAVPAYALWRQRIFDWLA